jgi:hypothetical protein
MRKEIVLAVALALGSTFAVAADEPCKGPDGKPVALSTADTDKDGKISKSECDAATKAGAPGRAAEPTGAPPPAGATDKPKEK